MPFNFPLTPDFNVYMDIQQAIKLALMRQFRQLGIRLALPVQMVQLAPETEASASPQAPRRPWLRPAVE
jgi:hypothetical protein